MEQNNNEILKTDFSKTKLHCSSIGLIMSDGTTLTPKQKWEAACVSLNTWQAKYDALDDRRKAMKGGLNTLQKINDWKEKVLALEATKDDDFLSKTAQWHLKTVYAHDKYGKWSASLDKGNKYTNKGTIAEAESIELICRLSQRKLSKNEIRVENEYLTGVPDLFLGESIQKAEYIIDVKSSWDIETFLNVLGKPLYSIYWWQIQGYFALTGAKLGEVSYCLVNTPESILNHERFKLKERLDSVTDQDPVFLEAEKTLINNMTFDDIPITERRLSFLVERDDEAIERIYKRVEQCRKYLSEIEALHLQGVFLAKEEPEMEESSEMPTDEDNIL